MTTFPDADLPLKFAIRFDGTTWVDLSSRLTQGQPASRSKGRPPGAGRLTTASFSVTLDNDDAALTPLNPGSVYWPNVRRDTPGKAYLQWYADQFTRSQTDTWGTDWTNSGGAASDYDVDGTAGTHTLTSTGVLRTSIATPAVETPDVTAGTSWSATATGASMTAEAAVGADASNRYSAVLEATTAGTVLLSLVRYVTGTPTTLAAGVQVGTYTPGQRWSVRVQHLAGQVVRAKAWAGDPDVQPDTWTHTVEDATITSLPVILLASQRLGGNTNTNPVVSWHEVQVNADQAYGYCAWAPDFVTDTAGAVHSTCRVTLVGPTARLFQGEKPLRSPLYRTMAGVAPDDYVPFVYWPMEDGADATRFASGLPGGLPVPIATGVTPSAINGPAGSEPLATLAAGATLPFSIPAYSSTQIAFQWFMQIPSEPVAEMTLAEFFASSGPVRRWKFSIVPGAPSVVELRDYDASGTQINAIGILMSGSTATNPTEARFYGHWIAFLFAPQQTGTDVTSWYSFTDAPPGGAPAAGNVDTGTLGAVTGGVLYGGDNGCGVGHLVAYTDPAFVLGIGGAGPKANVAAMNGYDGETDAARFSRVCHEKSIPALTIGSSSVGMGPQPIDTLSAILGACEDGGQGVLGEHELGLVYVTAAARYNQATTLQIDLAAYQVHDGDSPQVLAPTYDDQNLITESTVDRPDGITAVVAASNPPTDLTYEDEIAGIVDTDDRAVQLAAWRANRGSIDKMRYPGTPVDLAANPAMIANWQRATAVSGLGRIVRTGLPAAHAPYDLDDLVDGCTDTYKPRAWSATYNGQPADPYQVGQYTDGRSRYGAEGTTTAEVLDATETGVDIQVVAGHPGWATSAAFPACYSPAMLIYIDGEVMAASACVSTGAGTYTLTVTRNVNGIPGGKAHAAGAEVFIVDTGRYGY